MAAIFVSTWLCLAVAGEGLARVSYADQERDSCQVDNGMGGSFKPLCHSMTKMFESGWVESDYNECGYRSDRSCKNPAADSLRVAVLGTSVSRGYWLPYADSMAGRMEHDLTAACHRPIDLQTVALAKTIEITDNGVIPVWHHIADHVPKALALHPDALVLVMSAFDLANYDAMPDEDRPPVLHNHRSGLSGAFKSIKDFIANDSRLVLVLRHIAYGDTKTFLHHELEQGDGNDYMRQPFTAKWLLRLRVADATIGQVSAQAHAAGVSLIVVYMPSRGQAVLSTADADRQQTHPFALGRALAAIAQRYHADFVDVTERISHLTDPGSLFFVINGHPDAGGDAVLAAAVDRALVHDVSSFARCRLPSASAGQTLSSR